VTAGPDDTVRAPTDAAGRQLGPEHVNSEDAGQALIVADAPVGGAPVAVRHWFDIMAVAAKPENDGSLAAAHDSARAYRSRAKADNTRAAYRSAVRAWCAWCDKHGVPPLPAAARDVAAFLAAGRDLGQAGNTLKLRAAAIRFLHRAAGLPSPTDTAEVSETMAGTTPRHRQMPTSLTPAAVAATYFSPGRVGTSVRTDLCRDGPESLGTPNPDLYRDFPDLFRAVP